MLFDSVDDGEEGVVLIKTIDRRSTDRLFFIEVLNVTKLWLFSRRHPLTSDGVLGLQSVSSQRSSLDTERFSSLMMPAAFISDGDSRSFSEALVVCLDADVAQ